MYLESFKENLTNNRGMSQNTLEAYGRDVGTFLKFLESKNIREPQDVTNTEVVSYLLMLKTHDKSTSTINRKLASIRSYYAFLIEIGVMQTNPTQNIKSPKVPRKELEYLTIEEIDRLLLVPDKTMKGKRDRAILELLYATGIRVNEIIGAKVKDVNLRIGFFVCSGQWGKARIIPIGKPAMIALEEYIYSGRDMLVKSDRQEMTLFVNHFGKPLTRQGLWKIVKDYGEKAHIETNLTPHILRDSFAVHMLQNGADLKSLQELMGHEDMSAMHVYLTVTKNRIKNVYDKTHPRA